MKSWAWSISTLVWYPDRAQRSRLANEQPKAFFCASENTKRSPSCATCDGGSQKPATRRARLFCVRRQAFLHSHRPKTEACSGRTAHTFAKHPGSTPSDASNRRIRRRLGTTLVYLDTRESEADIESGA